MTGRDLSWLMAIALSGALALAAEPSTSAATSTPTAAAEPTTLPTSTRPATGASVFGPEAALATSLEQATGRFDTALRKARDQYLRDLTELRRRAIKAEDLAVANELNQLIERLNGGGGAARAEPDVRLGRVTRALVRADQEWQRSPALVRRGETIRITANGEWVMNNGDPQLTTYGPDGLRRDGTADYHGMWAVLWARIGYKVYFVGRGTQITAEQDGFVEFRSNDFNLGDNRGAIAVQVTKE